jgi:amidophosphoribosyltransferase
MGEIIDDKCGIYLAHSLDDGYKMGKFLQHRGRGGAGIAGVGEGRIDVVKWVGNVTSFDINDMYKLFPTENHYHFFIGHVRYPTKGIKENSPLDAHPHVVGGNISNKGSHIIIEDCDAIIVHNGQVNERYFKDIDKSKLTTNCDSEALLHYYLKYGEEEMLNKIPGSYTAIIADKKREEAIVLRDKTGIKPGSIGWKDGKHQVASEDRAFFRNNGKTIEEIKPGSVYYFNIDGSYRRGYNIPPEPNLCFFCFNYLAHHESTIQGVSVNNLRFVLGEELGEEFMEKYGNEKIDFVGYLPRCPEPAARGFSSLTGIPFLDIFYKMRDERAFQGPNHDERKNSIEKNLNLTPNAVRKLKEKTVVVIDDSIVRGTNIRQARKLLYEQAGVKKAFFISYTPPIGIIGEDGIERGCEYGVDMPKDDSFIARNEKERRNKTTEEISNEVKMPILYLSKQGMERAYNKSGLSLENMCHYCIGGEKPF